jgi:hypothetical protein
MVQGETLCKIMRLLCIGRWDVRKLAADAGLSTRTIRRYIAVISVYFNVQESMDGNHVFYWLEDQKFGTRARTMERFCKRGHDKMSPHGGYAIKYKDRQWLACAVCTRARNNESYARNGRKGRNADTANKRESQRAAQTYSPVGA